ncbi:MAG: hypothetical protein QW478_00955 [Candidatus Micrarchaeaceae archaeon]
MDVSILKSLYNELKYDYEQDIQNKHMIYILSVLCDNNYDPDKILLKFILKNYNNYYLTSEEYMLINKLINKIVNSYNLTEYCYTILVEDIKNIDIIKVLIEKGLKCSPKIITSLFRGGLTNKEVYQLCPDYKKIYNIEYLYNMAKKVNVEKETINQIKFLISYFKEDLNVDDINYALKEFDVKIADLMLQYKPELKKFITFDSIEPLIGSVEYKNINWYKDDDIIFQSKFEKLEMLVNNNVDLNKIKITKYTIKDETILTLTLKYCNCFDVYNIISKAKQLKLDFNVKNGKGETPKSLILSKGIPLI